MKTLIGLVILLGIGSAVWWATTGLLPQEQIEYLKVAFKSESAENTANSAAKLGKVLKSNFDDAQEVYEHGAEAKYN